MIVGLAGLRFYFRIGGNVVGIYGNDNKLVKIPFSAATPVNHIFLEISICHPDDAACF
jgi:hypothetical protein